MVAFTATDLEDSAPWLLVLHVWFYSSRRFEFS